MKTNVSTAEPRAQTHLLAANGGVPNHPRWPLLVYPGAVAIVGADPAVAFEQLFTRNRWPAAWRNGVYPFHHFHTKAHEALGVYSGEVTVQLGGEDGRRQHGERDVIDALHERRRCVDDVRGGDAHAVHVQEHERAVLRRVATAARGLRHRRQHLQQRLAQHLRGVGAGLERERQSLEPLLATPAQRGAVVSGKIAAACLVGFTSLLLTLLAFKVGAAFSRSRWITRARRRMICSMPSAGRNE